MQVVSDVLLSAMPSSAEGWGGSCGEMGGKLPDRCWSCKPVMSIEVGCGVHSNRQTNPQISEQQRGEESWSQKLPHAWHAIMCANKTFEVCKINLFHEQLLQIFHISCTSEIYTFNTHLFSLFSSFRCTSTSSIRLRLVLLTSRSTAVINCGFFDTKSTIAHLLCTFPSHNISKKLRMSNMKITKHVNSLWTKAGFSGSD